MKQTAENEIRRESTLSIRKNPTPMATIFLAGAAAISESAGIPICAAFAGWVAYFTRGSTLRDGAYNLACTVTGLGLGAVAYTVDTSMEPILGIFALLVSLLVAAGSIYLVQFMTEVENVPSYFLGVLVMLAPGTSSSIGYYLTLTAGVTAGAFAAALPDLLHWKLSDAETQA